jgi:hypothetical protein
MVRLTQLVQGENTMRLKEMKAFLEWPGFARYRQAVTEYWGKYSPLFAGECRLVGVFEVQKGLACSILELQ